MIAEKTEKFILDPNGFFKISIGGMIMVRHYKGMEEFQRNKINKKIVGNNAIEIGHTIARLKLIGDFEQTVEHAMDIGQELQKAEIALQNDLEYVQDQPLSFTKKKEEIFNDMEKTFPKLSVDKKLKRRWDNLKRKYLGKKLSNYDG